MCIVWFTKITFRQKRLRLDRLINSCQKLNLPYPDLVAQTALVMLEKDLGDSKKHYTQKLLGAAIYSSCKFHDIQISTNVSSVVIQLILLKLIL